MPIKLPSSENIPYLLKYEPFTLPENELECELVQDMFSLNVRPLLIPNELDYYIGVENSFAYNVIVKNITSNATLSVVVDYDSKFFVVNKMMGTVKADILPNQEYEFFVEINKESFDSNANYEQYDTSLKLTVVNYENGKLITKNKNVSLLDEQLVPYKIVIN